MPRRHRYACPRSGNRTGPSTAALTWPERAACKRPRRLRLSRDFRTLVLGDDALNLHQQRVLGGVAAATVEKDHLDAGASEFLQEDHLVGVFTRQAIRIMDIEAVEGRQGSLAPVQMLQGRTQQGFTTIAIVDEAMKVVAGQFTGADTLLQGVELTGDGVGHLTRERSETRA